MILKEFHNYKLDYAILTIFALVFIAYFILMRNSPEHLLLSTTLFSLSYIVWGIWHHKHAHHLTIGIVLEYFLIAVLGISLVATLLI